MASTRTRGAVAAGHRLTAGAAREILRAGGNAFDAVVAGLAAACVAEPILTSPGGGGFLMARSADTGKPVCYDFFTQTPAAKAPADSLDFYAIDANFGPATQEFHIGRGAAAVPGLVPGLLAVHDDLCTMPLGHLLAPAVRAGHDGWALNRFEAYLLTVLDPILNATEGTRALFAPEGRLIGAGETYRNRDLAGFFERLGAEGQAFYHGKAVRQALLEGQAGGGHLTPGDFDGYRVAPRDPLSVTRSGASIALNPPPSAGGAYIAYELQALAQAGGAGADSIAEALYRTDEIRRRHRGDQIAVLAEAGLAHDGADTSSGGDVTRGTTHISVIDADGNAAALTASNGEGNGHIVNGFGFMLNNMLGEQDLNPDGFHQWLAGIRLSSMMAPSIVECADGTLIALGSGGSNRIRTAIFQVLVRLIDEGLAPAEAVTAARMHYESGQLDFEDDFGADVRSALAAAYPAHRAWPERNLFFGGVHVTARDANGAFSGAGDARRAGVYLEA